MWILGCNSEWAYLRFATRERHWASESESERVEEWRTGHRVRGQERERGREGKSGPAHCSGCCSHYWSLCSRPIYPTHPGSPPNPTYPPACLPAYHFDSSHRHQIRHHHSHPCIHIGSASTNQHDPPVDGCLIAFHSPQIIRSLEIVRHYSKTRPFARRIVPTATAHTLTKVDLYSLLADVSTSTSHCIHSSSSQLRP